MVARIKTFIGEIRTELAKVSWTSRHQLIESTKVVLMSIFLLALFIGACDFLLSRLMQWMLR